MAIIPAGTANLLASNLGLPGDIEGAVTTGLRGRRRRIDAIRMNDERFAVMAGAGFDADMIRGADGGLKDRLGRASYVWTGAKSFRTPPFKAKIKVDEQPLVQRLGELHPGRQRRRAVRGRAGVRRRRAG